MEISISSLPLEQKIIILLILIILLMAVRILFLKKKTNKLEQIIIDLKLANKAKSNARLSELHKNFKSMINEKKQEEDDFDSWLENSEVNDVYVYRNNKK